MKRKRSKRPFVLSVPEPCSQDWSGMLPVKGGRFCNQCQKPVVDFSGLTDAEVYRFFASAKTIPCGRFRNSQLNTDLQPQERKRLRWKKIYRCVAALFAVFTLKNASVSAQTKEATTVQPLVKKNSPDSVLLPAVISGTVKGEDGTPVENAEINFDNKTVARSGADGSFSFEVTAGPVSKSTVLKISHPGLMAVVRSYHPAMQSTSYTVVLEKPHFDNGFTGGMPVLYNAFAPQTFQQPPEMNNAFRQRLADMAATFRNNPMANVRLIAYGTTAKEIKAAKKILSAVKIYFVEKEGISEDRFFIKISPMQKGKGRTVDIEPYTPE